MRFFMTDWALDCYVEKQKNKDVAFRTHIAQRKLYEKNQQMMEIVNIAKMARDLVLYHKWPAQDAVAEAKNFHDLIMELANKEQE